MLIIAAKTGGPAHLETIEEVDKELTKVIEDFDRAVNVEALLLARRIGEHGLFDSDDSLISLALRRARAGRARAR